MGRTGDPYYRIVAADGRMPRDGRYIEQIGYYNPNEPNNIATIDEELALKWLHNGATPSDTVRALFTKLGIMEKFHNSKKAGNK